LLQLILNQAQLVGMVAQQCLRLAGSWPLSLAYRRGSGWFRRRDFVLRGPLDEQLLRRILDTCFLERLLHISRFGNNVQFDPIVQRLARFGQ